MNTDSLLIGLIGYERDVLGAVMLSEALRPVVAEIMEDGDWVSPDHLTIWKVMRDGKSTTAGAVIANLEVVGALDRVGAEPYIVRLIDVMAYTYVRFPSALGDCLAHLHGCAVRRRAETAVMERAAADVQDIRAGTKPQWWSEYEHD